MKTVEGDQKGRSLCLVLKSALEAPILNCNAVTLVFSRFWLTVFCFFPDTVDSIHFSVWFSMIISHISNTVRTESSDRKFILIP